MIFPFCSINNYFLTSTTNPVQHLSSTGIHLKQKVCDPAMLIAESQASNDNLAESSGLYMQNKIKFDGKVSLKTELIAVNQKTFCFWASINNSLHALV